MQISETGIDALSIPNERNLLVSNNQIHDGRGRAAGPLIQISGRTRFFRCTISGNQCRNSQRVAAPLVLVDAPQLVFANNYSECLEIDGPDVQLSVTLNALMDQGPNESMAVPAAAVVGNITRNRIMLNNNLLQYPWTLSNIHS